jgi:hypothetical protein
MRNMSNNELTEVPDHLRKQGNLEATCDSQALLYFPDIFLDTEMSRASDGNW